MMNDDSLAYDDRTDNTLCMSLAGSKEGKLIPLNHISHWPIVGGISVGGAPAGATTYPTHLVVVSAMERLPAIRYTVITL